MDCLRAAVLLWRWLQNADKLLQKFPMESSIFVFNFELR